MAKFVARIFIPGTVALESTEFVFEAAWEAWEYLADSRLEMEAIAARLDPSEYMPMGQSAWGDMNELAQPNAYDDDGLFKVASVGRDWYRSKGTGTIWGRLPGMDNENMHDKGLCYQVAYEIGHSSL